MLKKLLEALAEKGIELAKLGEKSAADGATDADHAAAAKAADEYEALESQVKTARAIERAQANASRPLGDIEERRIHPAVAKAAKENDVAAQFGMLLKGMYMAKNHYGHPSLDNIERSLGELGYGGIVDVMGGQKALTTLTGPSGGFIVPEDFSEELIPLLYEQSGFMRGNPRRIPMPHGNFSQAGGATGSVASYRGEGDDIAVTGPTFRQIEMRAHLLSAIVPMTNQFLQYSVPQAAQFVRDDLAQAASTRMDRAAFLGSGTNNEPLGIFRLPGIQTIAAAPGTTPNVGTIEGLAARALQVSTRYSELRQGQAWVMTPRVHLYLSMLRGSDDKKIYDGLTSDGGTWLNRPVIVVGTVPEDGGAGTNEARLALVSFGSILFGESKGLAIDMSSEASWRDGQGDLQSAFSTDSTLFRARMEHDWTARYIQSVIVITGIQWGAA